MCAVCDCVRVAHAMNTQWPWHAWTHLVVATAAASASNCWRGSREDGPDRGETILPPSLFIFSSIALLWALITAISSGCSTAAPWTDTCAATVRS